MVRSFAFTTEGKLHSKDIELFLMPTLLADTKLFLWVDLEDPTPQETGFLLKNVFHFHPLSIEDSVTESPSPKVEEYLPKEKDEFSPYLFMVMHIVRSFFWLAVPSVDRCVVGLRPRVQDVSR